MFFFSFHPFEIDLEYENLSLTSIDLPVEIRVLLGVNFEVQIHKRLVDQDVRVG